MSSKLTLLAQSIGIEQLKKEAYLPDPKKDQAIAERLQAKERALAEARGFDPGKAGQRIGQPAPTPQPQRATAYSTAPTLVDKSIQQQHAIPLKQQVAHKARTGIKDFLRGKGGLGGKWRNRLALAGGLGLLGGGVNAYLGSREAQKPQAGQQPMPTLPPSEQQTMQDAGQPYAGEMPLQAAQMSDEELMGLLGQMYPGLAGQADPYGEYKQSNYSPSASGVPMPPSSPRVSAPGPGVSYIPTIKPGEPPKLPGGRSVGSKGSGSSSSASPKPPAPVKTAENDAAFPLLGAGLGALGGWSVGEKALAPLVQMRRRSLQAKIQNAQDALQMLNTAQKKVPAAAAATGALLLAALTALAIRKKQDGPSAAPANGFSQYYNQHGGGFHPADRVPFGSY